MSQKGITIVEAVVIGVIFLAMTSIAIPKFSDAAVKNKMWDGLTTLMTYESSVLAYFAQNGKIGRPDSLVSQPYSNNFFSYSEVGTGTLKAVSKQRIGPFARDHWLLTEIDTAHGFPRIKRSCMKSDSMIVRKLLPAFFY